MLRKEPVKKGGTVMAKPSPRASNVSASLRRFLKSYEAHCVDSGSCISPSVRQDVLRCIEKEKNMTKITLAFPKNTAGIDVSRSLRPLLLAVRDTRYTHGRELVVWDVSPRQQDFADLREECALLVAVHQHLFQQQFSQCLLLEKRGRTEYPFRQLELLDCRLDVWSLGRLGRAVALSFLTSLCLDYTLVGEEGVRVLLCGLEGDNHVLSLSLCYCSLGPGSGGLLAALVSRSAVRDLYVNGNDLQCEGATELVNVLVEHGDCVALEEANPHLAHVTDTTKSNTLKSRTASSEGEKRKSKGKKMKKKSAGTPPQVGPWLEKLHLSDNAIDTYGPGRAPRVLSFIQNICSLIKFSTHLAELDLSDNHIGDLSGELLLEALQERRKAEMTVLKIKVSTQMSEDTFAAIWKNSKKIKSVKKRKKAKK